MRKSVRRAVVVTAVLATVGGTGAAYAAWIASGSGDATARATSAVTLTTLDASATTTADLYPGAAGDVTIRINNPNPYPVRITAVTGNGPITAKAATALGSCEVTGVTFDNQTGQALDVAANSAATFTFVDAAHMSNASDNGCQGATFLIPVTFSGSSNAS